MPQRDPDAARDALNVGALALAYIVTAQLGLSLGAVSGFATLVWPPAGIALFALLRFGFRLWPGVMIGALVANSLAGAAAPVAVGIATGNTLEAVLAAWVLRSAGFDLGLSRLRDAFALFILAALAADLLGATIGVGALSAGGLVNLGTFLETWRSWWLGDALGTLTVTPFLLLWWRREAWQATSKRISEAAVVFAMMFITALTVFFTGERGGTLDANALSWPFFTLPMLYWASLRFAQQGAVTATLLLATVSIAGTAAGYGPFLSDTLSHSLTLVQRFMAVSSMSALVLAAAVSERDRAQTASNAALDQTRFLARASAILSSSLDYETTLQAVAPLVVPRLGDNCVVDVIAPDGTIRRVAEAAALPEKLEVLRQLRAFPPSPERPSPVNAVLKSGKTLFIPQFDAAALERLTAGDAYNDLVRKIGPTSSVTVPLTARGKVLGAITFGMAESGRVYEPEDLVLAEELASRAGVAIDHALVFRAQVSASAAASEALKVREDFLAVAGHELKTPLTSLLLQLQGLQRALKKGFEITNLGDRLERATGAGLRLENLINQLLDVSRISSGRLKLEPEPFELEQLLREVVDRFSEQAQRVGSQVSLEARGPAAGTWDKSRIDQVLTNLVSNALKYGEGRPVEIALKESDTEAVVTVVDHGIGIAEEQQHKIFDRFERAVGTREFGGFGLGLWICRQIAQASGGRIEVKSAPGEGSTFTLRLPLSSQPAEEPHVVH
jgi:signal transduction histidine kinase/integral membrane sensor domain MASE1